MSAPEEMTGSHEKVPVAAIQWAIASGKIPDDLARLIERNLQVFQAHPDWFNAPDLHGTPKYAELVVKLGFWLATGCLSPDEFRFWADYVPPHDNLGWDVDLLGPEPGTLFPRILKMGPLYSRPEDCLAHEVRGRLESAPERSPLNTSG